jgi:hypothetical protein
MSKKKTTRNRRGSKYQYPAPTLIETPSGDLLEAYGFGDWIKRNAGNVVKGIGGAALLAVPGMQATGAGLLAGSVGGIVSGEKQHKADEQATADMEFQNRKAVLENTIQPQQQNVPVMARGGVIHHAVGQEHEESNGGIEVDNKGNPSALSGGESVALTEKGELTWLTPDKESYVFSNRLKLPGSKKTFAKEAKGITNKFKLYLGDDFSKDDKLSMDEMNARLNELMLLQESMKGNTMLKEDAEQMAMEMAAMMQQQGMPQEGMGMEGVPQEGMPQEGMAPEEMQMMQEQPMEGFRRGGNLPRYQEPIPGRTNTIGEGSTKPTITSRTDFKHADEMRKLSSSMQGLQANYTKAFSEAYPDVPVADVLRNFQPTKEEDFDNYVNELIGKYGDLKLPGSQFEDWDSYQGTKSEFERLRYESKPNAPGYSTAGKKEGGRDENFGWRNMLYRSLYDKELGTPYRFLDDKTKLEEGGKIKPIDLELARSLKKNAYTLPENFDIDKDDEFFNNVMDVLLDEGHTPFPGRKDMHDALREAKTSGNRDFLRQTLQGLNNYVIGTYDDPGLSLDTFFPLPKKAKGGRLPKYFTGGEMTLEDIYATTGGNMFTPEYTGNPITGGGFSTGSDAPDAGGGGDPLYEGGVSPLGLAVSTAGNIAGMIGEHRNRPKPIKLGRATARTVSLEPQRKGIRDTAAETKGASRRAYRGAGVSRGAAIAGITAGETGIDTQSGRALSESYMNENLANLQSQQQADAMNLELSGQEQMFNAQRGDIHRNRMAGYRDKMFSNVNQYLADDEKSRAYAGMLQMSSPYYNLTDSSSRRDKLLGRRKFGTQMKPDVDKNI